MEINDAFTLWKAICLDEGSIFTTSGRGSRPGIPFTYVVSRSGGAGGRHYKGENVEGYGNELWIITDGVKRDKSISRSTVELGYKKAMEDTVKGPKSLGIPGAGSYVYAILLRFGVISTE